MKRRIAFVAVLMTILAVAACTGPTSTTNTTAPWTTASQVPPTVVSTSQGMAVPVALRADCETCHADVHGTWAEGAHANTQDDVAAELGEERSGETPKDVLHGDDPENCIACHGPTAVSADGGMSEVNALSNFFTTTDGVFSEETVAAHTGDWPSISCTTCHEVPVNHPVSSLPTTSLFDSSTVSYTHVAGSNELCGQCHGTLKFPDTDHVTFDHWAMSPHNNTQDDVAAELAEERAGETPDDVIHGDDAENCIACHGPSAILADGGMTEDAALSYFFTTDGGAFSDATVSDHASEWSSVGCVTCHDPHEPDQPALLDSSTGEHVAMSNNSELCGQCHGTLKFPDSDHVTFDHWAMSPHNNTQDDVAAELAEERAGETPDDVIHGDDAENCVACHGPSAILANGGMTEDAALSYFFTTDNGMFGDATVSDHASEWPSVGCVTCHDPHEPGQPALLDSSTGERVAVSNNSELCGQCHGSVRFESTDHLTYDAWSLSTHAATQDDVAAELAEERAGETPSGVISGDDPENCIACHGPTAVQANGGMTEDAALSYFFTTDGGQFSDATVSDHASEWPDVSCTACHDPHEPGQPALFESSSSEYVPMDDSSQLCGQCHGSLRFPDTDHLSYDVVSGTGGIGVPDERTMPIATCTSCHMYTSDVDGSNSSMQHGHSWAIFVPEEDGTSTSSCSQCHSSFSNDEAADKITAWQDSFESLHTVVADRVESAVAAMDGVDNAGLQAKLDEAVHNLALTEGDESGGFHNHNYLMDLLKDARARAEEVLASLG